jgi:uncharacterized protein
VQLVLDTNTAVSGLLWSGAPARLISAAELGSVTLISSAALLAELQGVLSREKFAAQLVVRGLGVSELFDGFAALVEIVAPAAIEPTVVLDRTDDNVLAAALAVGVDYIVSGDAHLLNLKQFHGMPIVNAATVVAIIDDRSSPAE